MSERWAWIPGYEYKYKISDDGIVQNLSGRPLKRQRASKQGHLQVHLFKSGSVKVKYVHRLVLEAFVGPCPTGMQCRHLNGIADDNRLENLCWGTASEDNYDRVRHGTHQHSRRSHCKYGHPLDGVYRDKQGNIKQRYCTTCYKESHNRRKRENKTHCPKGHELDGIRYRADGTVRGRYCKTCTDEQLTRSRGQHWAQKTYCPHGHPLDGVIYKPDGSVKQRYCKTCHRNRAPKATLCPNGHEHDMVRRYADGTERPYCTKCQQGALKATYERKRAQTHCKYGHPLDAVQRDGSGRECRYCKTCRKLSAARRREAKRAAKME